MAYKTAYSLSSTSFKRGVRDTYTLKPLRNAVSGSVSVATRAGKMLSSSKQGKNVAGSTRSQKTK